MNRQEERSIIAAKLLNDIADITGSSVENEDFPIKITNKVLAIANELDLLINEDVANEKPTYKVGEKVVVISCSGGHNFQIGDLVTLTVKLDKKSSWECTDKALNFWYLSESEFEHQ